MPLPSLLVFGPQTSWPSKVYLLQLREVLLSEPRLESFVNGIRALPELWTILVEKDPRLNRTNGLGSIQRLLRWIDGETEVSTYNEDRPNTLTMPFTIIIHLIQYFYYFDNDVDYPSQSKVIHSVQHAGVQGFCAGMLTAVAVACSNNEQDVNTFGAVAMRLAFCVGVYADLDSELHVETVSLAVRWRSDTGHDRVREILKCYNDAYISVIVDETDVTVTVPKTHMAALSQELSEEGMSVIRTGLEGRYHSSENEDSVNRIMALCESHHGLCLPDARDLLAPVRSNTTSRTITQGGLTQQVLHCIIHELADWHATFSAAASDLDQSGDDLILSFGTTKSIPSSFAKQLSSNIVEAKVVEAKSWALSPRKAFGDRFLPSSVKSPNPPASKNSLYNEDAIAVIGMACKFPGADSVEEFWQLLSSGSSMLDEMPDDRFSTEGLRRTPDRKFRFFGNFVRDIQAFDHRFFKKSSREAASMDPQQRLILQCAYEALESSGHFGKSASPIPNDTGCFIGVCTNDYNDNVASHNPNAYSSLGTLRAFISGKISHYFGWSGPSLTFDTACSSSAVAIHDACRSLQGDECSQAVAGGINLFTTPYFYENLVAASFLSPTGQTKPFDAKADGYCRGEGAGLVVMKKLSTAIADGDTVMGVISASRINQNSNAVGITVPHSPSQAALYTRAVDIAGVDPKTVSYVEAHGTGTPVGDPREIASIREVFGGPARTDTLHVSSVKGNIGHLEAASGVASLIKTLLMIKHNTIPVQASFNSLNPAIPALEPDHLAIPRRTQPWDAKLKVACINNYGASGSNATMVVCEPPPELCSRQGQLAEIGWLPKYPVFISANSHLSLMANCAAIQAQCTKLSNEYDSREFLASLAFNLSVKQNRSLQHVFATSAASIAELDGELIAASNGTSSQISQIEQKAKPVILVFGGQINNAVGLSEELYDSSLLLRSYLDQCDIILRSFGLKGLFPEIFQTSPVSDIVSLQSMVFSLQYSCSKAWMDSGLKIDAVIGHSLGQYAAMCISGTLSIEDGLKLVSGRASLMQKHWGSEPGSMLAIEADQPTTLRLLSVVNAGGVNDEVEVACYNGPTSHVLVGREASINKVQEVLADNAFSAKPVKSKRLNVTQGFHSVFTEPLLPSLKTLAGELAFKDPVIPLETCSSGQSWGRPNAELISEHTRSPVYFGQAIERLAQRFGPCTWLEAGSASSVVGMVRRALDPAVTSQHSFQSAQLSNTGALESLADTTVNLWKWGHHVQFWQFHQMQKEQYTQINLPPYQFEKTSHWLAWEEPSTGPVTPVTTTDKEAIDENTLMTFIQYRDQAKRESEYSVNTQCKQWKAHVSGHAVLSEPLCPAPMYVELLTQAANRLCGNGDAGSHIPLIEDIEIKAPLGLAQDRRVTMIMMESEDVVLSWGFEVTSQPLDGEASPISHATGYITLQPESGALLKDFSRYEKIIGYDRFATFRSDSKSEALQGSMVYKNFSKVVNYADYYKGVRGVFSRNEEAVGRIVPPPHNGEGLSGTITAPLALDSFIQVSGIHVNNLEDCSPNQVYVCTKLDRIQVSPAFRADDLENRSWDVYTNFTKSGDRSVSNDIYVFDASTRGLVLIVMGAFFTRVSISSLTKVLSQANNKTSGTTAPMSPVKKSTRDPARDKPVLQVHPQPPAKATKVRSKPEAAPGTPTSAKTDLDTEIRLLIHRVADVPVDELKGDASLEGLGIDSLMVTEVASEMATFFGVEIDPHDFETLPDIKSLSNYVLSRGYGGEDLDDDSSSSDSDDTVFTSTPDTTASPASELNGSGHSLEKLAMLLATHLETKETIGRDMNLAALGLDSLMCMELATDINKGFGVDVDMHLIDDESTFGDLCNLVTSQQTLSKPTTIPCVSLPTEPAPPIKRVVPMETLVYKKEGKLPLKADVYYPPEVPQAKMPVALLIHGGGHCLYSRKDVNSKQIKLLLSKGFLCVSVEYRLCPEVKLLEGPMTDVRDALRWIRYELPSLKLNCPGLRVDGDRVAVVGWSTGGTLAMSLGFTPQQYQIKPPEAILAFYCPSNYDDDCFKNPIYPRDSINSPDDEYDLLDSVRDEPIASYIPNLNKGAPGSFLMGLSDSRWRIILHMNWKAQMVPILINGLPSKAKLASATSTTDHESYKSLPMPSKEQIASINPYAQIQMGNYKTPTFIMHGTDDDLVPCKQSRMTIEALREKGVQCGIGMAEGARHLFDTFASEDPRDTGVEAVRKGYAFLGRVFGIE